MRILIGSQLITEQLRRMSVTEVRRFAKKSN